MKPSGEGRELPRRAQRERERVDLWAPLAELGQVEGAEEVVDGDGVGNTVDEVPFDDQIRPPGRCGDRRCTYCDIPRHRDSGRTNRRVERMVDGERGAEVANAEGIESGHRMPHGALGQPDAGHHRDEHMLVVGVDAELQFVQREQVRVTQRFGKPHQIGVGVVVVAEQTDQVTEIEAVQVSQVAARRRPLDVGERSGEIHRGGNGAAVYVQPDQLPASPNIDDADEVAGHGQQRRSPVAEIPGGVAQRRRQQHPEGASDHPHLR